MQLGFAAVMRWKLPGFSPQGAAAAADPPARLAIERMVPQQRVGGPHSSLGQQGRTALGALPPAAKTPAQRSSSAVSVPAHRG